MNIIYLKCGIKNIMEKIGKVFCFLFLFCFVFLMEVFTGTDYLSRKQDHVSHVMVSVGSHQERGSRTEPFFDNWK